MAFDVPAGSPPAAQRIVGKYERSSYFDSLHNGFRLTLVTSWFLKIELSLQQQPLNTKRIGDLALLVQSRLPENGLDLPPAVAALGGFVPHRFWG
ncbi:MAG TPA: hypothetical protein VLX58_11970 [Bryobacteraceae bacterium]|nr:hypothetical protein [Bryobacteraceae bacterium]